VDGLHIDFQEFGVYHGLSMLMVRWVSVEELHYSDIPSQEMMLLKSCAPICHSHLDFTCNYLRS